MPTLLDGVTVCPHCNKDLMYEVDRTDKVYANCLPGTQGIKAASVMLSSPNSGPVGYVTAGRKCLLCGAIDFSKPEYKQQYEQELAGRNKL